jgi:hypothetical protein
MAKATWKPVSVLLEAVVSVPENYSNALKNGIWRRVSALSKLMMDVEGLEPEEGNDKNANTQASRDVPVYTTYETAGQRQPLNPISTTATSRRGVGRKGKCGRKGNAERVIVIEDKHKRTKGADSHKDYREAVKNVLRKVVENAHECNQFVRAAATQAQTTSLKDYNITISLSWCRALIPTSIKTGIHVPTMVTYYSMAHAGKMEKDQARDVADDQHRRKQQHALTPLPLKYKYFAQMFKVAWDKAFTRERNMKGWEKEGILPRFNMKEYWRFKAELDAAEADGATVSSRGVPTIPTMACLVQPPPVHGR